MRTLAILYFVIFSIACQAQTYLFFKQPVAGNYYTSSDGSGSECSQGSPCTLSTALGLAGPGDNVLLLRDGLYETGDLSITAGIAISAWGSGADPVLTGSDYFGDHVWTSEANGFYSTPLSTEPKWVYIDGEAARQGQTSFIQVTSEPSSTSRGANTATLNAFNSVQSLIGANVRSKEFDFRVSYEYTITNYNTGTGVFTLDGTISGMNTGSPFWIYGQQQFATAQNDWYWDDATDKLFIKKSTSPFGIDIRVGIYDYAFNIDVTGVEISEIEFEQYYRAAINADTPTNLYIHDVLVHDIRTNGLWLYGNATGVRVEDFEIYNCGLNGIFFGSLQEPIFDNFYIYDIGQQDNFGWPLDTYWRKTGGSAIVGADDQNETIKLPNNVTITDGRIENVGYQGISQYGEDWDIRRVVIDTYCVKFCDGGGIHTFYRNDFGAGGTTGHYEDIIITNGIGNREGFSDTTPVGVSGFYGDNGSSDLELVNVISYNNLNYGIQINWNTIRTSITGGTTYGNGFGQVYFNENRNAVSSPNFQFNVTNVLNGHTLASINTRPLFMATSFDGSTYTTSYNPFSSSGDSDNNIYFRPMSINVAVIQNGGSCCANPISSTFDSYSLAAWRTRISDDALSVVYSNFATSEIGIDVNDTSAPLVVPSHGSGYKYMDGTSYTGTTLQPFTCVVYYKD